jgi:hypothetical protein
MVGSRRAVGAHCSCSAYDLEKDRYCLRGVVVRRIWAVTSPCWPDNVIWSMWPGVSCGYQTYLGRAVGQVKPSQSFRKRLGARAKRASHIDPPKSPGAIVRKACPERGENSGRTALVAKAPEPLLFVPFDTPDG